MITLLEANAYLVARYGDTWTNLGDTKQLQVLTNASDYLLANYTPFDAEEFEDTDTFKSSQCQIAYQYAVNGFSLAHSDPIKSKSESLEGLTSESVTYEVTRNADPFPQVTLMMRPIASRIKSGGFQVVQVMK